MQLFFILFLLVLSAFFSAAETALFSLSKIDRRRIKETHPVMSRWVFYHLDRPAQTLSTVLIGNLFVNVLATALVTILAIEFAGPVHAGIIVTLFSILLILFAELIPKILAVRKNQTFSLVTAFPLRICSILIFPFRKASRWVTDWVLSFLTHEKKEAGDHISQEELKALIKIGEEEGILDRQERYMIQKTIQLGERSVKDIMTPRVSIIGLDIEDSFERHVSLMKQHHHSHFAVYKSSLDNILGMISVQDYMLDERHPMLPLLRQPLFVPDSKRIDDLLTELRTKKLNFALCVDEYGGTAGLVTLEDILEEIFGEFYDEYAKVQNPIRPLGHGEYLVEAKISLSDFNEYFAFPLESQEASTLGGFILERLGEVPHRGQVLKLAECEIKVNEVIRQRHIRSVLVKISS